VAGGSQRITCAVLEQCDRFHAAHDGLRVLEARASVRRRVAGSGGGGEIGSAGALHHKDTCGCSQCGSGTLREFLRRHISLLLFRCSSDETCFPYDAGKIAPAAKNPSRRAVVSPFCAFPGPACNVVVSDPPAHGTIRQLCCRLFTANIAADDVSRVSSQSCSALGPSIEPVATNNLLRKTAALDTTARAQCRSVLRR